MLVLLPPLAILPQNDRHVWIYNNNNKDHEVKGNNNSSSSLRSLQIVNRVPPPPVDHRHHHSVPISASAAITQEDGNNYYFEICWKDLQWNHTGQVLAAVQGFTNNDTAETYDDVILLISVATEDIVERITALDLAEEGDSAVNNTTRGSSSIHIHTVRWGGKSRYLCITTQNRILVWDLKRKCIARSFQIDDGTSSNTSRRRTSALLATVLDTGSSAQDEAKLVVVTTHNVLLYHLKQAKLLQQSVPFPSKVRATDISNLDGTIVVALHDGSLEFYSPEDVSQPRRRTPSHRSLPHVIDLQWILPRTILSSSSLVAVLGLDYIQILEYPSLETRWKYDAFPPGTELSSMAFASQTVALGTVRGDLIFVPLFSQQQQANSRNREERIRVGTGARLSFLAFAPCGHNRTRPVQTNSGAHSVASTQASQHPPDATPSLLLSSMDRLNDQIEVSFRNLHIDMLRQFQLQSEDLERTLLRQAQAMEQLVSDNRSLRIENAELREELEKLKRPVTK